MNRPYSARPTIPILNRRYQVRTFSLENNARYEAREMAQKFNVPFEVTYRKQDKTIEVLEVIRPKSQRELLEAEITNLENRLNRARERLAALE
jgi:hypothetical protein